MTSEEDHIPVVLICRLGERIEASFHLSLETDPYRLRLEFAGQEFNAYADDVFEALCHIRKQLEPMGLRPHCYGASRNEYPSGMARDMGPALKAFKLTTGLPASYGDLVDIFGTGPDVEPVSVEEQEAFFEIWAKSVGRTEYI